MHQPKDYLTAVNLARRTEFVDRTIADIRSCLNNCKESTIYTLLHDKLRQDLTFRKSKISQKIEKIANRDRNSQASVQPYHRRDTGGFTSQDPASYRCGVVGHKACVCPNQSHDYYTSGPWRKNVLSKHIPTNC